MADVESALREYGRAKARARAAVLLALVLAFATTFIVYITAQSASERIQTVFREAFERSRQIWWAVPSAFLSIPSIPFMILRPMFPESVGSGHVLEILKIIAQVTALVSPVSTAAIGYFVRRDSSSLRRAIEIVGFVVLLYMQLAVVVSSMLVISDLPADATVEVSSILLARPISLFLWSWILLTVFLTNIAYRLGQSK